MKSNYMRGGLLLGGILLSVLLLYPAEGQWMLSCPLHKLTGLDCPFCGGQRMLHSLLHGKWGEAFRHNPVLLCMLPWLALGTFRMFFPEVARCHPRLTLSPLFTDKSLFLFLFSFFLWGIFRNIEKFL